MQGGDMAGIMMGLRKAIAVILVGLAFVCSPVFAVPNTSAMLTADDVFGLYHGQADGSGLSLVGQSTNTWNLTNTTFSFDVNIGDYLYVVAYDDTQFGPPHMFIGSFDTPNGALVTNLSSWNYYISTNSTPAFLSLPSDAAVQADITAANLAGWLAPTAELPNGSSPWGTVVTDPNAKYIWPDSFSLSGEPSSSTGHYVLFRSASPVAAIPEPEIYAMLAAGLGLMGFVARRRKQQATAA